MAPQRCTRCILPATVPGISFAHDGICSFCQNYVHREPKGEAELFKSIEAAKAIHASYDCIVPLSGGRDSTYVLYLSARRYGLRPLAVNFDNDFREEGAIRNINAACVTLGVELVTVSSAWHIPRKLVASRLRQFLSRTNQLRGVCDACSYGYRAAVYRTAISRRIPLILWGSSAIESSEDSLSEVRRIQGLGDSSTRAKLANLLNPHFYLSEALSLCQRIEMPSPGHSVFSRRSPTLPPGPTKELHIFSYIPWDRQTIKDTIIRELGWAKPPGKVSTWRTDCKLHDFINSWYITNIGCTKDAFGYSRMINAAQMSRSEALDQEMQMMETSYDVSVAKRYPPTRGVQDY